CSHHAYSLKGSRAHRYLHSFPTRRSSDLAANYLSAGPYKFKGWSGSNNKYSYVKNNKYYDADKVKTKKIAVQTIKDQNTGYNLYQGKKLDFTPLSPDQVKASKSKKGYKEIKSGATQALQMNQEKVPE